MNYVVQAELNCDSEACQLDWRGVATCSQDDKVRLDVTVDDGVIVTVAHSFQHLTQVMTDTQQPVCIQCTRNVGKRLS